MTSPTIPIASIILLVVSAFILAMTKRERLTVGKKALKAEHKEGFKDLLLLVEKELSSLEPEIGALDKVRKRLRWEMK